MKPEQVAKLPPEERQEYENSLKITKFCVCVSIDSLRYLVAF